ncbi:MAG: glycoside hydrolase family 38 [Phycisphaerae bacterium]|nr:glycoside hydrolase family 38 [Phycisphaerae bacterium]
MAKQRGRKQASSNKPVASDKTARQRGCYVASTHWDREWYEPFQHYRYRLVAVIDQLIDLMEADPDYTHYQLDGQSVVLEDYLEIRPEQFERLQMLFDDDRVEAGPWYVLPDEFLPCGESLVRNLLRGHQVCEQIGTAMKVGFACDLFGHVSQLPQIFHGFGIDTAAIWRGTNAPKHPGLFNWQSPDGSTVLTYAFADAGYGQYQFEVRDPARRADRTLDMKKALAGLRRIFEVEEPRVPGRAILFFDGIDHVPPEPKTSALLKRARQAGLDIRHTRLCDYFADVRRQKLRLQTFKGELRETGEQPGRNVIPGVLSSRIYLKQRNAACENLLLQWVEPFSVCAMLVGQEYPMAFLDHAWRYLLRNHPHDSICGCSIDQVHRDMEYRFDQCRLIGDRARHMSLRAIADSTPLPKLEGDEDFAVTVFNPTVDQIDGVVNLPLYFNRDTKNRFQEWFGYEPIVGFRLFNPDGQELAYQRLDVIKREKYITYDALAGYRDAMKERVNVATRLRIPPNGWTTIVCKPTKDKTRSAGTQLVDDHTMRKEHLTVSVNTNGTLDITDHGTGCTYHNALTIEDRADIGDGWFHGTAVNDEFFSSIAAAADVALVHDGFAQTTFRIRVTLNVPKRFEYDEQLMRRSTELVPLVITHWVTLKAGSSLLEVRTEIDNTVRDHRVRVLVPTHLNTKTYFADCAFDVMEREIALRPDSHTLHEPEVETKPQATWTAVNDGKRGLALISTGQPESAVRDLPDRPIALTLMRGFQKTVGTPGEPGGQMMGVSSHVYWIYPHSGALPAIELCRLGQRLAGGLQCIYTEKSREPLLRAKPLLPASGSWYKLSAGPLVVTACKLSEDGDAIVIRAHNPTDEPAKQRLELCADIEAAFYANMLEEPGDKLAKRGGAITVTAEPRQIVTLRLELPEETHPA